MARSQEFGMGGATWVAGGGTIYAATLTVRHSRADRLAPLLAAAVECWRTGVLKSHAWQDRDTYGVHGYLRALEVTWGTRNGWHPHFHVPLFTSGHVTLSQAEDYFARIFSAFRSAAIAQGLSTPEPIGQRITSVGTPSGLVDYVTTGKTYGGAERLGLEVSHSQAKIGRTRFSTEPAWDLLDRATRGDSAGLRLWHEYEAATRGKRWHTWGPQARNGEPGFRTLLGLGAAEASDDNLAAVDPGTEQDRVLIVPGPAWDDLATPARRHLLPLFRAAVAAGDGLAFARDNGIRHFTPSEMGFTEGNAA
jgi:hypothetical protein